ncbi:MAG: 2-phosphosulfolactate phosphatase [Cyanobacteria bacterium NC_groundwater_1444_Ag_S-0.65um_54_12]|nr:2-phosphosulfolactate phosphatase [Cyanobacteria bacterium NC_groundwater_1444_Ag_S-0.65um_54_12]
MKIEVVLALRELNQLINLAEQNVVVIDVLRATSSMVTATKAGCQRIIPAASLETAHEIAASLADQEPILAGERGGLRPADFHLGNSPAEFVPATVANRTIIMATTNGSWAICQLADQAKQVFAASFLNISATAEILVRELRDVTIICCGKDLLPGLEDVAGAGLLTKRIKELADCPCDLSDTALIALAAFEHWPDITDILHDSAHGQYLAAIGMGSDLDLCAVRDSYHLPLHLARGAIVAKHPVINPEKNR